MASLAVPAAYPECARGQAGTLRERIDALRFPEMRFAGIRPESHTVRGVPVHFFQDDELPLVTFYATFEGGVRNLAREHLAAASAMPNLLRTGGTAALPPDSVDVRIELLGLAMSFGQGGGGASSWVNALSEHADEAVRLWGSMLRTPRFDSVQVERWRGTELERVRRARDDPGTLAFGRFNHIMYGDHPVGWELGAADLEPADLAPERLHHVHGAIICPDNLALGVTGDVTWPHAAALIEEMLDEWPPCSDALLPDPVPEIRDRPGVFVIHREIEQSVIVMAHASRLRQGDNPGYFASRVANSILGASGFSSRLVTEVRTREGLAYGVSSLWTTSSRNDGLVGALTRTRPETTLEATRLILATFDSMRAAPPTAEEVARTVDETVNGFVFNFRTPLQVISRGMAYRALGLPEDWLERYVRGVQSVTPNAVQEVFRREVDPARMTILLVGDTTRFDGSPSELGTVTVLDPGPVGPTGGAAPGSVPTPPPAGVGTGGLRSAASLPLHRHVDRRDPPAEKEPVDPGEAGRPDELGQLPRARKVPDRLRQIAVRPGVPGYQPPRPGQNVVEVQQVGGAHEPSGRHGELEHHEPPARPEDAPGLAEAVFGFGQVSHPEPHRDAGEGAVRERQAAGVGAYGQHRTGSCLAAAARQHRKSEVRGQDGPLEPAPSRQFDGQIEGAGAHVEECLPGRGFPFELADRAPAPPAVEVEAEEVIEQVVAWRDLAEEGSDALGPVPSLVSLRRPRRGQSVASLS